MKFNKYQLPIDFKIFINGYNNCYLQNFPLFNGKFFLAKGKVYLYNIVCEKL